MTETAEFHEQSSVNLVFEWWLSGSMPESSANQTVGSVGVEGRNVQIVWGFVNKDS